MVTRDGMTIEDLLSRLQRRIDELPPELVQRRIFLAAYLRATQDIARSIDDARFEDLGWVELWTIRFADVFFAAHDADRLDRPEDVPRPWRLVFAAPAALPPAQHLLLGLTAHLNYDLPLTLQTVISNKDFTVADLLARRRRDFQRIDAILRASMTMELAEFGPGTVRHLVAGSVHRFTARRLFRDVRDSVWHNVQQLQAASTLSTETYQHRLSELALISAAKITELLAVRTTAIRWAACDFVVLLPPPGGFVDRPVRQPLPQQRRSVTESRQPDPSTGG